MIHTWLAVFRVVDSVTFAELDFLQPIKLVDLLSYEGIVVRITGGLASVVIKQQAPSPVNTRGSSKLLNESGLVKTGCFLNRDLGDHIMYRHFHLLIYSFVEGNVNT